MVIKAYVMINDCGDGSQSCKMMGTKEEALKIMGFSSEEEMKENWTCWYEDGGYKEVEIEVAAVDGVLNLIKGFSVNTDDIDMS